MRFKNFLFLFLFFVFVASALAQPPFQSSTDSSQATVLFPKDDHFELNKSFNFHVHFINSSNYPVIASQFSCVGHFYNTQNQHVLELNSLNDANGYDDYFVITTAVTGVEQTVPYNILCNSSQGEAAFISGAFFITTDSEEKDSQGSALLAIVALIPLIFGLFMVLGASSLGDDHNSLRIALFLLSPISVFLSLHFAIIGIVKYYGMIELQDAIGSTTYWMGWFFFALITYFGIYAFYKAINTAAQKKEERLNY